MGLIVFPLRTQPLLLVIVVAAAVYGAALVLLRALDPDEWAVVRAGLTRG
jgi:hypothetical protein